MAILKPEVIVEIPLASWSEFCELVNQWIASDLNGLRVDECWFRGQAASHYQLIASLDRALSNVSAAGRNRVQMSMIELFKERTANTPEVQGLDDNQILAILQHHGAPTRLLDWTASPYIGAFFAFAGDQAKVRTKYEDDDSVAVWALRFADESLGDGLGAQTFTPYGRGNLRVGTQHGRFTRTSADLDGLEEHVRNYYRKSTPAAPVLLKLVIPQAEASIALTTLEHMGVSSETMFPGLEGAARYAFFKSLDVNRVLSP
jgi:hypothetical protein